MLATIGLHVHESCMRVAVRVLHSCAFICRCYLSSCYIIAYNVVISVCSCGSVHVWLKESKGSFTTVTQPLWTTGDLEIAKSMSIGQCTRKLCRNSMTWSGGV